MESAPPILFWRYELTQTILFIKQSIIMKRFLLSLVALMVSVATFAQVTTSSLTGVVTDESGEALVGATVSAIHTPSGARYDVVTNADGRYSIMGVRAGGPYTVQFSFVGLDDVEFEGVQLPLGETATRDAYLRNNNALETIVVAVDGAESAMNVKRSGAGTSISRDEIEMMPSVSRSMNDVLRLTPQASTSTGNLSIGGGNYRQSYVTVDGAAFNNAFGIGGNLPAGGTPISLEALDMVAVSVTPFDVRQSGFTGGAISAVTKSGTNNLEVSVYDYYESNDLQGTKLANDKELNVSESLTNTLGVNIGAPIIKDKLFVFANFEYEANEFPGNSRLARPDENAEWGYDTNYNRPTVDQMETIKDYLSTEFGYNPGRYQDYSIAIPNYKFMGRVDWNINNDHHLNVRYSNTMNKYSNNPSSSTSPLYNPYDRTTGGRDKTSALYFESSRYYQKQNFSSVAAELNSRFMDGKLNNIFRATYSHQYEPRSFEGELFPTVDILQDNEAGTAKEVMTTFGPDPFTYGNLRDVATYVVTDEVTYTTGIHSILGGLQFEHNNTKNGFMPGGAGYYVFNSWDDFVNGEKPAAFAMTHSNRSDLKQVFPQFNYMQYSAYVQDEMNISDRFKATVGIRFEMPVMPSMDNNENKEFTNLFADKGGYKTSDMPKATLNISPRVGFNWDLTGERKYMLRGGTGIFTGRIPFVWIVSAFGNSNCLQAQTIYNEGTDASLMPNFAPTYDGVLNNLYGGKFEEKELPAPTSTTIMDKNLKMQAAWKSSLAFEANLPYDFRFNLEGIYNQDMNSVITKRLGQSATELQLPGEPEARTSWKGDGIKNSADLYVNPYLITNADINGYYASITAQLEKSFDFGLNASVAYTYSDARSVVDGTGDQVTSAYNTSTYNRNGSNVPEIGFSNFVSPNRLLVNLNYRKEYGNNFATSVGLYYEGSNVSYIGGWAASRYSYTVKSQYGYAVTNDYGAQNLLYVPTEDQLASMPFADVMKDGKVSYSAADQKADFMAFINDDPYLSTIKGEYSERGGAVAPWYNNFGFKIAQDFYLNVNGKRNTLTVGLDVDNFANMLNRNWGNYKFLNGNSLITYNTRDNNYQYNNPSTGDYVSYRSAWSALLSVRYTFN